MLDTNVKKEEIDFLIKINNIKNHNEKIRMIYQIKLQTQEYRQSISEFKKYILEKSKETNRIVEEKNRKIEEKEKIIQNMNLSLMIIEEKKSKNIFLKLWNIIFDNKKELENG